MIIIIFTILCSRLMFTVEVYQKETRDSYSHVYLLSTQEAEGRQR